MVVGGPAARACGRPPRPTACRSSPARLAPVELASAEGLEILEHNADTILEEVGVEVRDHPSAVKLFAEAGADIDGSRVRFPRGMCRQIVQATAPAVYTQHARNPDNNVQIGGDATVFAPNYGSPFVHDLEGGRRYATLADFQNFVKLAYMSPNLHHSGGTVCEPVDVPVSKRHLDMVYAHIKYSDKGFMGSVTAGERAADCVELARIAFGGDLQDRTVMTSLINASSPLVWDSSMLAAAEVYAQNNQATIITPFILAGAMAPTTSAGVAAQTLAEALAGMTFVQLVRPGRAGGVRLVRQLDVDAERGADVRHARARTRCCTPSPPSPAGSACRSDRVARSPRPSCRTRRPRTRARRRCIPTMMAGTNFVLHAAGWLEGGLAIGYEKFVLDADQLGMMATFVQGLDLSENGQALDAIRENPPGQHYLGTAHTLANFESAFYRSDTADNSSFEQWLDDGGLDAAQRASRLWRSRLDAYEPPPIDDAIDAELVEFIERRKSELPDTFA